MEIDWGKRQLDRYLSDGQRALQRLTVNKASDFFLDRSLDLLTNYLSIPNQLSTHQSLDEVMAKLAQAIYGLVWPRGYWNQLSFWWPKMVAIVKQLPDPTLRAEITLELSVIKNNQGESAEALRLCKELVTSPDFHLLSSRDQANLLHHLGICYLRGGDYEVARKTLGQCLSISRQHNHWEFKAFALNQLGNIAMFQGDLETAHNYYQESLTTFEVNDGPDNYACIAYQSLGRLLVFQRRFREAIPMLEKGLAIRQGWGELEGAATNAAHLAEAYLGCGKLEEAEALLNEALRICKELNYLRGLAVCYLNFGRLEAKRGHIVSAIAQYHQALDILGVTPLPPIELRVLINLLPHLLRLGRLSEFVRAVGRLFRNLHQQKLSPIAIRRLSLLYLRRMTGE